MFPKLVLLRSFLRTNPNPATLKALFVIEQNKAKGTSHDKVTGPKTQDQGCYVVCFLWSLIKYWSEQLELFVLVFRCSTCFIRKREVWHHGAGLATGRWLGWKQLRSLIPFSLESQSSSLCLLPPLAGRGRNSGVGEGKEVFCIYDALNWEARTREFRSVLFHELHKCVCCLWRLPKGGILTE